MLSSSSDKDALRFALLIVAVSVGFLFLCVGVYILLNSFKDHEIDWVGLGAFMGGLFAPITGVMGAKAYQRKQELRFNHYEDIEDHRYSH